MSLANKPLPMNQLCVAMVQDLGKVYENNAAHEKNDLDTVWESMYSKGLQRKVSSQCYFTPQEIEEAQKKEEVDPQLQEESKSKQEQEPAKEDIDDEAFEPHRDFEHVHLSRAMNSGRAHLHDHGRRYRKRTFSGSSSGEPHDHL